MAAWKITERRAADAARQLLYHQRLMEWISRKTEENEATLKSYLIASGEDRVVLLGGYVLERAGEDHESAVEVSEPSGRKTSRGLCESCGSCTSRRRESWRD